MTDFFNIPTATAPPVAAKWKPASPRTDSPGQDSFAETLQRVNPKREQENREAENAAASQAVAQERKPEIIPDDPPPAESAPSGNENLDEKPVETVEASGLAPQNTPTAGVAEVQTLAANSAAAADLKAPATPVENPASASSPSNSQVVTPAQAGETNPVQPVETAAHLETAQAVETTSEPGVNVVGAETAPQAVSKDVKPETFENELKAKTETASPVASKTAGEQAVQVQKAAAEQQAAPVAPADGAQPLNGKAKATFGEENQVKVVENTANQAQTPLAVENHGKPISAAETMMNEPARLSEARSTEVIKQISQAVDHVTRSGQGTLRLQLSPQDLGKIDLRVTQSAEGLQVVIQADQASTGRLLEANLNNLRQTLQDAGITLSQLSVGQGNQHPDSESWKGSQSGNGHKAKQFINQAIGIDEGQPLNPTRMNSLVDYQV